MAIGRHECRKASRTDLRAAIAIGLDECMTALEESFYDLTDEQVWAFPVPERNNIAWIVMHCLDNLDEYAVGALSGKRILTPEWRWDLWESGPEERPQPGDEFPAVGEMLELLRQIREAAEAAIAGADVAYLTRDFSDNPGKPWRSDFAMRTICHTEAHVRQIWLLRGALGLVDGQSWPRQHWA